jgi:sporulation-control protein spo0M
MIEKKEIIVTLPPSVNPRQNISMEVSGQVKSFPFFDGGVSLVRAVFDKDSYYVGETAHVECFVNNTQFSQTIRYLEIKIRRRILGKDR